MLIIYAKEEEKQLDELELNKKIVMGKSYSKKSSYGDELYSGRETILSNA